MDRQLLERMIGAAVLIVALIVIVPAVLNGPRSGSGEETPALSREEPLRTVTLRPDRPPEQPPVPQPLDAPASLPPETPVEVAEPVVMPPPAAVAPQPESAAEPKPIVKPPAPVPAAPKTPKPASPAPAPVTESGWAVQLGSFASRENAEKLVAEVSRKGFTAYLVPLQRSGKTLFRVRVGPRQTREDAEQLAGKLASAGYKGQVARQEPGA